MAHPYRPSLKRVVLILLLGVGVAFSPAAVSIESVPRVMRGTSDAVVQVGSSLPKVEWTRAERRLMRKINRARDSRGIHKLRWNRALGYVARKHSKKMREEGDIFHSELGYTVRAFSWSIAGENVGMGPSVWSIHDAFMQSPGHRKNNLRKSFYRMGVGVLWENGTAYITVLFLG